MRTALLLSAIVLAAAPGAAEAACARPGERVVTDGAQVQVLRAGERRIGCLKQTGKRVLLAGEFTQAYRNHRLRSFAVNGRVVAWWTFDQHRYGSFASVTIARLPHGPRRRVRVEVDYNHAPPRPLSLAVGEDGSAVWALERFGVYATAGGATRRVGYLDGRAPVHLRVGGGAVSWTVNAATHTARIAPAGTCGPVPFGEAMLHDRSLSLVREQRRVAVCRHGDRAWQVLPDEQVGHVSVAGDFLAWSNAEDYRVLRQWDAAAGREVGSALATVYGSAFGGGWGLRQDGALFFQELRRDLVALVRRDAGGTFEVLATEPPAWGYGIFSTGSRVILTNHL